MNLFDRFEDPRRRLLIKALAVSALAYGSLDTWAAAAELFGRRPDKLPPGRAIHRLTGDVRVNGEPATMQTVITTNDTIETGRGGEVIFAVAEQAFIVRSNSHVALQAGHKQNSIIAALRIVAGKVLTVFPPRRGSTSVATSTCAISIRGTGFYIEADPEQTYFCTCYGVTEVTAANDPASTETVAARHHDKPLYILAKASEGQSIRPAPFINHTDQELALIEALVGRAPPFIFPAEQYRTPRRSY